MHTIDVCSVVDHADNIGANFLAPTSSFQSRMSEHELEGTGFLSLDEDESRNMKKFLDEVFDEEESDYEPQEDKKEYIRPSTVSTQSSRRSSVNSHVSTAVPVKMAPNLKPASAITRHKPKYIDISSDGSPVKVLSPL